MINIPCSALQLNADISFYPVRSVKFPLGSVSTQRYFRNMKEYSGIVMLRLPSKLKFLFNN